MIEEASHPLFRMASVTKVSFWIFFGACVLLYIYNKITMPDSGDDAKSYGIISLWIFVTAFTGLFLNLIAGAIERPGISRIFNIACYLFEVISVILLGLMIVLR